MFKLAPSESTPTAFDDFFDHELYNPDGDCGSIGSFSIFEQYLNDLPELKSDEPPQRKLGLESLQPWRKGFWSIYKKPASNIVVDKLRKPCSHPADDLSTGSPHQNGYFDNITSFSVHNSSHRKGRLDKSGVEWPHSDIRSVLREQTPSPSPMYTQLSTTEEMKNQGDWQELFHNSNIQIPARGVQFESSKPDKHHARSNREQKVHNGDATVPSQQPHPVSYSRPSITVKRYPTDFQRFHNHQIAGIRNNYTRRPYDPSSEEEMICSLEDKSYDSHIFSIPNLSTPQYVPTLQLPPGGWKSPSISAQNIHCGPGAFDSPSFMQTNSGFEDLFPPTGLDMSYPSPEEIGCAVPYGPAEDVQYQLMSSTRANHPSMEYPTLPPPFNDDYGWSDDSWHRKARSTSSPLSPSRSPDRESNSSRSAQQRSPSRDHNSRRKSISRTGPMKESTPGTTSPKRPTSRSRSQTQSGTKARHRSVSAKANKAARNHNSTTTSLATFDFDFVNFTLKDSAKLMTDVAPSGSSKTKARRDQEAKDKRKRINEVALSAVRAAGGDVRDLELRLVS